MKQICTTPKIKWIKILLLLMCNFSKSFINTFHLSSYQNKKLGIFPNGGGVYPIPKSFHLFILAETFPLVSRHSWLKVPDGWNLKRKIDASMLFSLRWLYDYSRKPNYDKGRPKNKHVIFSDIVTKGRTKRMK